MHHRSHCLRRAPPPPPPPPPALLRLRAPSLCALLRQSVLKVLAALCPLRQSCQHVVLLISVLKFDHVQQYRFRKARWSDSEKRADIDSEVLVQIQKSALVRTVISCCRAHEILHPSWLHQSVTDSAAIAHHPKNCVLLGLLFVLRPRFTAWGAGEEAGMMCER